MLIKLSVFQSLTEKLVHKQISKKKIVLLNITLKNKQRLEDKWFINKTIKLYLTGNSSMDPYYVY